MRCIKRFSDCESGATAIEYGVIIAAIAVVIVAAAEALGLRLNTIFLNIVPYL